MKRPQSAFGFLLIAFMAFSFRPTPTVAEEQPAKGEFVRFMHKAVERKYLLHLPEGLPDNAPIVFMLHGYRGNAKDYMGELGLNQVADANAFAVCYPQGLKDREGIPHWNARLKVSEIDDIGFLSELATYLQKHYKLNPARTFTSGISNGGFMSYALVAERPDVFRAAASIIGTMSGTTWKQRQEIRPVPILQISGLNDEVVPYDGSMSPSGGWGGAPDQDTIIDFWRNLNETKTESVVKLSERTTAHRYQNGVNGNEVWHYKVKRFGHRIPGKREMDVGAMTVIWEFFSQFPKPSARNGQ